ncbi:MAG: imidazoleglycerol-phosphate dehydratase HisB [Acidimicrobiales bacterium]|nr:imidazoleglycerol-phosphate dehydratase HisB [Acidimicrobiales bacterium]|tara:strand:- start:8317 stop:8907 length:591 start_codon:yes stop_codon:yes gene_type:complete
MTDRKASIERKTKETNIEVELNLDGGNSLIETGIPFFTHMLEQLAKHSGMGLSVKSVGDLEVDAHHTVEDVGISIGEAFNDALGEKLGIRRFASVSVPLDEALVDVALDISGRAFCNYEVDFPGEKILGNPPFDPQLMEEFWRAFVAAAKITLHISLVRGKNTHHIVEATFKGVARSLRDAVRIESTDLPSTKGSL